MTLELKEDRTSETTLDRYFVDTEGKKQGLFTSIVDNVVIYVKSYIDDVLEGDTLKFSSNGKLESRTLYKDNKVINSFTCSYNRFTVYLERTVEFDYISNINIDTTWFGAKTIRKKITTTKCDDIVKQKHIRYFRNGSIAERYQSKDGKQYGVHSTYYSNGQCERTEKYHNGVLHGDQLSYHPSGELCSKEFFTCGKKTGVFESYSESGSIMESTPYVNDRIHGEHVIYDECSLLPTILYKSNYVRGVKDGLTTRNYSDGQVSRIYNYKNGQKHGICYSYNCDGNLSRILCYNENKLYGEAKYFANNGSGRLLAHYMHLQDGEQVLARKFMQDLGIPYKNLQTPSEDEKVMITLALGGGVLFCDE